MKKNYFTLALLCGAASLWGANPFTPGNLVVYRVGDGQNGSVATAQAVALEEYKIADDGTLSFVQRIDLPTEETGSSKRITAVPINHLEGGMTRSSDGRYLVISGYNAPVGGNIASVERVCGFMDYAGILDATSSMPSNCLGSFRGATSADGTFAYCSGSMKSSNEGENGSLFYVPRGSSTPTVICSGNTYRHTRIFDNHLYVGNDGYWYQIGTDLPTELVSVNGANRETLFRHYKDKTGFYDLFMVDYPQGKVAYVATTGTTLSDVVYKGVFKYSLVDDVWVYNGTTAPTYNCHALEGKIDENGKVTLYITVGNGPLDDADKVNTLGFTEYNEERILRVTDESGFNGAGFEGAQPQVILTAPTYYAYRSIAWAPVQNSLLSTPSIFQEKAKIYPYNHQIVISSPQTAPVQVYSSVGSLVYTGKCVANETLNISLDVNQIYLVQVGTVTEKICL